MNDDGFAEVGAIGAAVGYAALVICCLLWAATTTGLLDLVVWVAQ
jgi:hypothetical protein